MMQRFADTVHTITCDNGGEYADHARIARKLECDIYLAKTYHAWERVTHDHLNVELRHYYRKREPHNDVHRDELTAVEDAINARYRKILGYQTAAVRFEHERALQLE